MSAKKHRPKEAQEIEDLVLAYQHAQRSAFTLKNVLHAHKILSRTFVARSRQGVFRREPVGVFSDRGLEYMAIAWQYVEQEMTKLFAIVETIQAQSLSEKEALFWASFLHVSIALIHPFSDGNVRIARLCEKWFLASVLGAHAFLLPTEEQYALHRSRYYRTLKLGVNYWEVQMKNALPFFLLLPHLLQKKQK